MGNFIKVNELIGALNNIANKELQVFVQEECEFNDEMNIYTYPLTGDVEDTERDEPNSIQLNIGGRCINGTTETSITVSKLVELLTDKQNKDFIYVEDYDDVQVKHLVIEKDKVILWAVEVGQFFPDDDDYDDDYDDEV